MFCPRTYHAFARACQQLSTLKQFSKKELKLKLSKCILKLLYLLVLLTCSKYQGAIERNILFRCVVQYIYHISPDTLMAKNCIIFKYNCHFHSEWLLQKISQFIRQHIFLTANFESCDWNWNFWIEMLEILSKFCSFSRWRSLSSCKFTCTIIISLLTQWIVGYSICPIFEATVTCVLSSWFLLATFIFC